jgi:F-box and leucine-rich repeat protein 4
LIFICRIIRIEFNHTLLDYYTGIDAVQMTGTKCIPAKRFIESPEKQKISKGIIQQKLETVDFRTQITPSEAIEEFLRNDLNKFIENIGLSTLPDESSMIAKKKKKPKQISDLPYEVLFKIFSYLDLKSCCRVSGVCRSFRNITIDPLLYQEVNLKFHWHLANSSLMDTLSQRCKLIRKLDMSSCGYFGSIISRDFIRFIEENGRMLTTLRLNSARFLNTSCLETISRNCKKLTELSLRNYTSVTGERDFSSLLQLRNLEILDLSRSGIDSAILLEILRNNNKIHTLKIAFASLHINMDDVCMIVSVFNPNIKSIDMWKSYSMSNRGLRALSECPLLEEINLGWTLRFDQESTLTESLKLIVKNCKNLRKLILAAVRGVTERDLENIANFGQNLEHLDLMGIVGVSSQMCQR